MQAPKEALDLNVTYVRICGGGIIFIIAGGWKRTQKNIEDKIRKLELLLGSRVSQLFLFDLWYKMVYNVTL